MSNTIDKVKMVKLGSICEQLRGVSYKKSDATDVAAEGHIPVLRANNIDDGLINFNSLVHVPTGLVKELQVIKKGDVVIAASSGSLSIVGKGAQATKDLHASFGAFCKLLRPNPEMVYPGFFGHYFQSKKYRNIISSLAAGANINNLKNEHLNDLDFPDIPLPEQKRIAEILDLADEARRKRRENLKLYDDLIRSLFLQTFGDPVSNPMGWETDTLKNLGKVQTGSTPPSKLEGMFGGAIPFVTPGDLRESEIKVTKRTLTKEGLAKSRSVESGSTLVCCIGATIGKMGKASELSAFNQQINSVSWGNRVDDNLGLEMLRFFKSKIAKDGASTTLPILKKSLFEKIEVPVPSLDLQNQFAEQVEEINTQKAREQALYDQHNDLFNALLQRAFKGEL